MAPFPAQSRHLYITEEDRVCAIADLAMDLRELTREGETIRVLADRLLLEIGRVLAQFESSHGRPAGDL